MKLLVERAACLVIFRRYAEGAHSCLYGLGAGPQIFWPPKLEPVVQPVQASILGSVVHSPFAAELTMDKLAEHPYGRPRALLPRQSRAPSVLKAQTLTLHAPIGPAAPSEKHLPPAVSVLQSLKFCFLSLPS